MLEPARKTFDVSVRRFAVRVAADLVLQTFHDLDVSFEELTLFERKALEAGAYALNEITRYTESFPTRPLLEKLREDHGLRRSQNLALIALRVEAAPHVRAFLVTRSGYTKDAVETAMQRYCVETLKLEDRIGPDAKALIRFGCERRTPTSPALPDDQLTLDFRLP